MSENAIIKGESKLLNWRTKAYSVVLIILLAILTSLIASRRNVDTTILRAPGILFQKLDSTHYSNLYLIKTINKTYLDARLEVKVSEPAGAVIRKVGKDAVVKAESKYDGQFFLILPSDKLTGNKAKVVFDIYMNDEKIESLKTSFLGPIYQ